MALRAQQTACVRCGSLYLIDTTGQYNVNTNPSGYGGPNADFGETTPYTAAFFKPTDTDVPTYTLDLTVNPPSPDGSGYYNYVIAPSDMAFTDYFPGGHWRVFVTFGTTEKWIDLFVYDELQKRIIDCICAAPDSKRRCMMQFQKDLEAACSLFKGYQFDKAQKMIDKLYRDTPSCCCNC